jgi:hypothetical protein
MLVSRAQGRHFRESGRRARPRAAGAVVIVGETVDHRLDATTPAAAITPAWRIPPPRRERSSRAAVIASAVPQSSDPTGADRPLTRSSPSSWGSGRRSR